MSALDELAVSQSLAALWAAYRDDHRQVTRDKRVDERREAALPALRRAVDAFLTGQRTPAGLRDALRQLVAQDGALWELDTVGLPFLNQMVIAGGEEDDRRDTLRRCLAMPAMLAGARTQSPSSCRSPGAWSIRRECCPCATTSLTRRGRRMSCRSSGSRPTPTASRSPSGGRAAR
jgi:hypothetical protein